MASCVARGGKGRERSMSATDLVACSRGRRRACGGDCRHGNARLPRAAEMRKCRNPFLSRREWKTA